MKNYNPNNTPDPKTPDDDALDQVKTPSLWIRKLPSDAQIIQIGSSDGKQGDPVFEVLKSRPDWKALFVEPVPYLFNRLVTNYGASPNYQFYNAVINKGEKMPFYYVEPRAKEFVEDLPFWFEQLGSSNRDHILRHLNGVLEPFIIETLLEGCSLAELFARFSIERIDLLHLDTEGSDWKILSQLDLSAFAPTLILFEHAHLSDAEKTASAGFLENDYFLVRFEMDTLAIHKKSDRTLFPPEQILATEW